MSIKETITKLKLAEILLTHFLKNSGGILITKPETAKYYTYSVVPFDKNNKKPVSTDMINIENNNGGIKLNDFLQTLQKNEKSEFKIMGVNFPKRPANTKIMYSRFPTKSIHKNQWQRY